MPNVDSVEEFSPKSSLLPSVHYGLVRHRPSGIVVNPILLVNALWWSVKQRRGTTLADKKSVTVASQVLSRHSGYFHIHFLPIFVDKIKNFTKRQSLF
jgi:hypothetical protein